MTDDAPSRDELLQRQDELTRRLKAIQNDLGRGLDRDLEEQSIQLENFEVLQEIARMAKEELMDIERQLARLPAED